MTERGPERLCRTHAWFESEGQAEYVAGDVALREGGEWVAVLCDWGDPDHWHVTEVATTTKAGFPRSGSEDHPPLAPNAEGDHRG